MPLGEPPSYTAHGPQAAETNHTLTPACYSSGSSLPSNHRFTSSFRRSPNGAAGKFDTPSIYTDDAYAGSVQFTCSITCPALGCVYPIRRRSRRGYRAVSMTILCIGMRQLTPLHPVTLIIWVASALGPKSEDEMLCSCSFWDFGTAA